MIMNCNLRIFSTILVSTNLKISSRQVYNYFALESTPNKNGLIIKHYGHNFAFFKQVYAIFYSIFHKLEYKCGQKWSVYIIFDDNILN